MTAHRFTVPGNPVPWERARSGKGRHWTAKASRDFRDAIRCHVRQARIPKLDGPVRLSATFFRASAQVCDVDNLLKAIQDALSGFAYRDDAQIVWVCGVKTLDRDNPRTEVEIETVERERDGVADPG